MPKEYYVKNFKGLITRVEDESLKPGYASDSLNWLTLGDHIELRRGQTLMGASVTGSGKITGLFVGTRYDGTQIPIRTRARKVEYYDATTELWVETTTANILPSAADGEDIAIDKYHSLAGGYAYLSSKNSSIYKLPFANPSSIVDLSSTDHRGKIRIKQNRMFLWDRKDTNGGFDQTGLYGAHIDKDELSDYTAVTAEIGFTGAVDGANKIYTKAPLTFKVGQPKRTCMYVSVYATTGAGVETFRDDRDGNLVSNFGGTGTIDYATGNVAVTFFNAPTSGSVAADYYWEDSTSAGIADFSKSTPRTAGQGFVFRQDDGGADMQNLGSIGGVEYCFHSLKTWALNLSSDDTAATNLIYRARVGIPYWRAMAETGDGVYYVDATDQNEPAIRLLQIGYNNAEVVPTSISDNLILTGYEFDAAVVFEWGTYICVACRTTGSTVNDTVFMYHKLWKLWDKFDFRASTFEIYNGGLIAGDSASNNVFKLFSDLTDEESEIPNSWTSGKDLLGMEGVKYANIFTVRGLIQDDQEYEIDFSYDNGAFVNVGTISGDGEYVDHGQRITVGSTVMGSTETGGGGTGIEASPYRREFRVNTPRFENIRVRFRATKVGYVSVSEYGWKDIRHKGRGISSQYQVN